MATITVQQDEYEQLKRQAAAYKQLVARFFESVTEGSVEEIIQDFRKSGEYTDEFLTDLEAGLKKSSLAHKKNAN